MDERKESNSADHDRKRTKLSHQHANRNLNATNVKQQMWLVKVPSFVASSWSQANNNDILGQMMVGIKPGEGTKQMIIKLDERKSSEGGLAIPTQFTLDDMKSSGLAEGNSMLAFNIDDDTKQFTIEGTVTKNLVLKPAITPEYQNFMRQRSRQKNANRREAGIVDNEELEKAARQSYTIEFMSSVKGELKKKGAAGKAATGELDSKALKSKMFEAFEAEERLSFESLLSVMFSQVSGFTREAELRSELEKYATYNHKGPHRGLWELKSQFKTAAGSSSTSAPATVPPSV